MPENKRRLSVVLVLVALFVVASTFVPALPDRNQSSSQTESTEFVQQRRTDRTRLSAETTSRVEATAANPAFALAATQNAALRNNLGWTFGGRQQRGWYLYTALIAETLKTNADASTPEFAQALSRWQTSVGLTPTGVLDENTWFKMFSNWQSRRLKNKTYAQPEQLVTVAASEFWDASRPEELRKVERETYAAYKRMVAAALADSSLRLDKTSAGELAPSEKFLKIISAFRSKEYQEQLRRQTPGAGSAGLAVNSPHFTGRALDLYVGGDPVETKDSNRAIQVQTPVYRWLVRNAERFGFRPYFYEPWHFEYVGDGKH